MYRQLDIWWVDLEPAKGVETKKQRPCVVLQSDLISKNSRSLIIAPLLPDHKNWPFVVNIDASKINNLDKNRHINLKQVRVIDISRVKRKHGKIEKNYLKKIKDGLKLVFDL